MFLNKSSKCDRCIEKPLYLQLNARQNKSKKLYKTSSPKKLKCLPDVFFYEEKFKKLKKILESIDQ